MSLSLYQATIPSNLQIIGAVAGLLDKAERYCADKGLAPETLIQARLAEDMFPFAYQITSVCHHSLGAIDGVRNGTFSPDTSEPPGDFDTLSSRLADAKEALEALSEDQVNELMGKPMRFEFQDIKIDFVAENFLLSFSQPNFYFHATTAYDILRAKGLEIGKSDFMGQLRTA
jgi:hypothetical protein